MPIRILTRRASHGTKRVFKPGDKIASGLIPKRVFRSLPSRRLADAYRVNRFIRALPTRARAPATCCTIRRWPTWSGPTGSSSSW